MTLTESQLRRYARHVLLPDVGGRGQARLLAGAVRVDVAAGAGEAALLYLAAAGVGTIVVTDGGVVQAAGFLYEASDVGQPRLEAVRARVAALNPDVRIISDGEALPLRLDGDDLEDGARAARLALEAMLA